METCSFCEIIHGRLPGMILLEDTDSLVIKDHKPVNKFHVLAIPKNHIPSEEDLKDTRRPIQLIKTLIRNGKRVMSGLGADMNDILYGFHKHPYLTIRHLHLHFISPRRNFYHDEHLYHFNTQYFISAGDVLRRLNEHQAQNNQNQERYQEEMHYGSEEQEDNCCVIL